MFELGYRTCISYTYLLFLIRPDQVIRAIRKILWSDGAHSDVVPKNAPLVIPSNLSPPTNLIGERQTIPFQTKIS